MMNKSHITPTEASLLVVKLLAEKFRDIEAEIMDEISSESADGDIVPADTCPECGSTKLTSKDKRKRKDGATRRVKECDVCGVRIATVEVFSHIIPDRPNRKHKDDSNADSNG